MISREDRARDVTDGSGQPVHVYAQSETTYGEPAGLFGINCGNHPELFISGATKVPKLRQSEEENAKQYAESQKQRKLERDFRKACLQYASAKAQGADEATVKAAGEKMKQADQRLDRFEKETGRRRRREREYGPAVAKGPEAQTSAGKALTDGGGSGTIKTTGRNMANGNRAGLRSLTEEEKASVRESIRTIQADESRFVFGDTGRTSYDDELDEINIRGDIFPDPQGTMARDRMSVEAVLAHEYYGHRANRGTKIPLGFWQDEMRASMTAAIKAPGLTAEDRQLLMRDAIDRAAEAGVTLKITPTMRRILYGYEAE